MADEQASITVQAVEVNREKGYARVTSTAGATYMVGKTKDGVFREDLANRLTEGTTATVKFRRSVGRLKEDGTRWPDSLWVNEVVASDGNGAAPASTATAHAPTTGREESISRHVAMKSAVEYVSRNSSGDWAKDLAAIGNLYEFLLEAHALGRSPLNVPAETPAQPGEANPDDDIPF